MLRRVKKDVENELSDKVHLVKIIFFIFKIIKKRKNTLILSFYRLKFLYTANLLQDRSCCMKIWDEKSLLMI